MTSNFSFSHNVFKSFIFQRLQDLSILDQSKNFAFGKELTEIPAFLTNLRMASENIVIKGENTDSQHHLFFPRNVFKAVRNHLDYHHLIICQASQL